MGYGERRFRECPRGNDLDVAEPRRKGVLQRLGVDDEFTLVPLLIRTLRLEFRKRNAQRLVHVDPVAEKVRTDALDHAGNLERLSVDTHPHGLLGGVRIAQFRDIPKDERRDEQRQKNRRHVAVHPFQPIFHHGNL